MTLTEMVEQKVRFSRPHKLIAVVQDQVSTFRGIEMYTPKHIDIMELSVAAEPPPISSGLVYFRRFTFGVRTPFLVISILSKLMFGVGT